jgi:tetrachlorobenzoquinone reductase
MCCSKENIMIKLNDSIQMRVHAIAVEALNIKSYDLRPVVEGPLPEFAAGAHIDLLLANGMTRSYSLVNAPEERWRYVVAVSRDRCSRGGSEYIHEQLGVGDVIDIHAPRNLFPLEESAVHSVLVAGGIGITPIFSMVRRLAEMGRSWHLVYCARSPAQAALLDPLGSLDDKTGGRIDLRFNEEPGYVAPDFSRLVTEAPEGTHYYCCGPKSLMDEFESATRGVEQRRVHTESFLPVSNNDSELGGFTVVLERSGVTLSVPQGETILSVVRAAGISPVASCEEGTCGTCEVAVLEGVPLHRDRVLSEEDKAEGATMMICCSGSKSEQLVLDL